LRVKPSKVPDGGKGLFASKARKHDPDVVFKANQKIAPYEGKVYDNEEQLEEENPDNAYILQVGKKFIDASDPHSGPARFANDCHKTKFKCNAKLTSKGNLVAAKPIKDGQEILTSYGKAYWKWKAENKRS
jgi:hypothetical protein